jgi:hypothetical protein
MKCCYIDVQIGKKNKIKINRLKLLAALLMTSQRSWTGLEISARGKSQTKRTILHRIVTGSLRYQIVDNLCSKPEISLHYNHCYWQQIQKHCKLGINKW